MRIAGSNRYKLQQQFIMVVAATNTRPEHPSFETAVDTISDLLKVRRVRKSWLAETSHHGSRGNIQCESKNPPPRGPDIFSFFSQTVDNL